ncbi:hypothetical protein HNY73_004676 [Argiope bruennichi]|uniref:Uncharacterized protein n=1 Tax=Argiope bruennichi TaxID=94029 RepID=A0A8T0FQQ4_ARGBR|nr:hypothetical protein HNY73_004676 [Argiope bruennichi]
MSRTALHELYLYQTDGHKHLSGDMSIWYQRLSLLQPSMATFPRGGVMADISNFFTVHGVFNVYPDIQEMGRKLEDHFQ